MSPIAGRCFHATISLLLCIGIYNMLYQTEENRCEMTYMFELPQYVKVSTTTGKDDGIINHSNYSLYLYGEGSYFQSIKNLNLHGIPVLYIPGHGGSYKQARSLGSVLLRKAMKQNEGLHFNVFSIDYKEELVALYGGTLKSQVYFAHQCIKHILSLYEHSQNKPTSVVILGHSMGGFIAKALFALPDFDARSVNTIVSLATPHISPVINIDHFLSNFYDSVNDYWLKHKESLSPVSLISVGGGPRDVQVPTSLTRFHNNSFNHFSTVATAVPTVHVSTDHQCIVWCKQLVLVTARFLFDIVDPKTKQVTEDINQRQNAVKFRFYQNPGVGKVPTSNKAKIVKVSGQYVWKRVEDLFWSLDAIEAGTGAYFSFDIQRLTNLHAPNFVARTDSKREKWILACTSSENEKCTEATDLSRSTVSTPKYRLIHLDLNELLDQGFTNILIPTSRAKAPKILDVNVLSNLEISNKLIVPHVFSNLWTFSQGVQHFISESSEKARFYYKVELEGFQAIYQAFRLEIVSDNEHIMKTEITWDDGHFSYEENSFITMLHQAPTTSDGKVFLHIYLSTDDSVLLKIKPEFFHVLGQIIRYFGAQLPVFVIANVMLTFIYQVSQMYKHESCHSLADASETSCKPYKIQPFVSLTKYLYGISWFHAIWSTISLPAPDSLILEERLHTWFSFAPLVLFLFAFEIFSLLIMVQNFLGKILSTLIPSKVADQVVSSNSFYLPHVALHSAALAIFIQIASPFALLYMYLASFLRANLLRISVKPFVPPTESKGDGKEEDKDTDGPVKKTAKTLLQPTSQSEDRYSVNVILSQLWLWLFLCSVPSFVMLLKNFRSTMAFPEDPMLMPTMIASVVFVLQTFKPDHDGVKNSRLRFLSWFFFPLAVAMVIFSMHTLHRVPWFVVFFLFLHTLMQIF
ncbi:GPI inositol-deacylase-like [Clavelina lepadiformis]|uniref:GPI inositol-deacylase-like n=1 Tax=Clavelina lepadiformis TaxID=159417 RepID=UPI00404144AC